MTCVTESLLAIPVPLSPNSSQSSAESLLRSPPGSPPLPSNEGHFSRWAKLHPLLPLPLSPPPLSSVSIRLPWGVFAVLGQWIMCKGGEETGRLL